MDVRVPGATPAPSADERLHRRRPARERALAAAVEVLAQQGVKDTTIALVIARAGVSRSTFQRMFGGLEDCIMAALDEALRHGELLVEQGFADGPGWRDGMRATLLAALGFLDDEPQLARVVMVQALAGGPAVLAHRERVAEAFRSLVVAHVESEVPHEWPLASEMLFASVLGALHTHLAAGDERPLVALLPALMASLLAPYSTAKQLAQELARSQELADAAIEQRARSTRPRLKRLNGCDATLLFDPRSRRIRQCLRHIAAHPDSSNRQVATGIGLAHLSQASRLLARLHAMGLLAKRSDGVGRRNIWRLTPEGEEALRTLRNEPTVNTKTRPLAPYRH